MPLDITDERVQAAAARLHGDGWSYSARQLYYAVCSDVETAPTRIASGEVGLGVLLILVGAITGQHIVLAALGSVGLLLLIVGVVTHVQERRPLPMTRLLAISFADFEGRFLDGNHRFEGLIGLSNTQVGADVASLVVCDRTETAAIVRANRERIGAVTALTVAQLPSNLNGTRIVTLHDCDPAGCALPADLREQGADVADAGINPVELSGRRLQVLEGAPARLPRDLSDHLDETQLDWLRSGRRLECATETPEQLAQRVQSALRAP
jgi:hypothetical protein